MGDEHGNLRVSRDSLALKLEEIQRKVRELRKERERMFGEHERERNVLHEQNLGAAKRKVLDRVASCEKFSEKEIEHNLELLATQKEDLERREREESLEEYRKNFAGVRGFSKGAGRYRILDQTANPERTDTLRPRHKKRRPSLNKLRRSQSKPRK